MKKLSYLLRYTALLLTLCLLAGCAVSTTTIDLTKLDAATPAQPEQDPKPFLNEYVRKLNAYDFGSCYSMLAPDTQEAISLVDYTQRHQNIFDAMELTELRIAYGSLTMEAGKRYLQEAWTIPRTTAPST